MLTINIDELDCTTYVETLYALARTTLDGRYSWRDYAGHLQNLRYRNGVIDGYASRLHYISNWAIENTSRGNIKEVTMDLPGARSIIKNSATYAEVKKYEIGYRNHKFYYIPKTQMGNKQLKESLQEGDIVGLVTKIEGLDVSHMGVIVKDEKGDIFLMDASMTAGKVQVESQNMAEMLRRSKSNMGIRVFRLKQD